MHLVYYAFGLCIVNGWLLYRRHCHQNGTCIQYNMHLEYALLMDGCCIEDTATKMVHAFSILCLEYALLMDGCCIEDTKKWYMHLVYYALGVCIVNGWLLYRRHRQQNGTRIQYTTHLEYAMDGGCIEDTASKMVHTFGILCTWSMHC